MKDNSLDGHRGKVALSDTTRLNTTANNPVGSSIKCELKTTSSANDGSAVTNFDDDNEWELGIGDLIIDLDADIEKTNERNGTGIAPHHHHHHHNGTAPSPGNNTTSIIETPNSTSGSATTFNFLGSQLQPPCNNSNLASGMSNSKSPRSVGSGAGGSTGTGVTATGNNGGTGTQGSGTFEHQATVDKGLKMKIKRKTVGSKYSEAKHEIVQSDIKSAPASTDSANSTNSGNTSTNASASNSPANSTETPKSKHSSSKGRTGSHREKKEKNRDKNSNVRSSASTSVPAAEVNGVLGVMSPLKITNSGVSLSSPAPPSLCSSSSPLPSAPVASPTVPRCTTGTSVANSPASNCAPEAVSLPPLNLPTSAASSPPMPNLTLKLENKFTPSPISQSCPLSVKQEDSPSSPPMKKIKIEPPERNEEMESEDSQIPPEMKDTSTCTSCTSVGTITEPDCLGPCEPGTSVMLEGIVWQETEGGVLVVNVTWRGKTYVGTLLDATKHDWAPPRFCESPTSDVDSKTAKGRGKRGRGGNNNATEINNFADARNCVQSKLRNGKGRRTTLNSNANSGFTVPNSPAKSDNGIPSSKRKGRPADLEISTPPADAKSSKRSRTQKNAAPTSSAPAELSQPSSPNLIVCPQPNCSKKYKHINGLKYHQIHAHSGSDSSKMDDTTTEDSKDVTNSSDNDESMQESASLSTSPAPDFSIQTGEKSLLNGETTSSSSSSATGLPESDPYSLSTDLSTLASVAIGDSKSGPKVEIVSRPSPLSVSQDVPAINSDGDNSVPAPVLPVPVSNPSPDSTSLSNSPLLNSTPVSLPGGPSLSPAVSAVTTSVIQSSNAVDSFQGIGVNIPTSHVIFSQGILESNSTTTCTYATSTVVCNSSRSLSPSKSNLSSNVTSTYATIPSIVSAIPSSVSIPLIDKTKIKQEKPDKFKPKSPVATSPIRPIVPAPSQMVGLSSNIPGSHPGVNVGGHSPLNSPLKPIQPKPTILGEPTTINPALESLKKEKSKHKKKSKDKDKERDKKMSSLPLLPPKMGGNSGEECEALELTSYPNLEAVPGTLPHPAHLSMSPLITPAKLPESSLEMNLPEDTINENVQSPAYSDISDANDTAPVLESEVAAGKEKEDKVGKTTPDAAQSPATNISAYGAMYPYYSNPPYLLPSVSPQNAVTGASQGQNMLEKNDMVKKVDPDRVKDNRPWSNPSGESRERQHLEQHDSDKKLIRDDGVQGSTSSPAAAGVPVQEYPMQQHYPYSYGYAVQGYPYAVENPYHVAMLETDPHYKQQFKQYLDEQQHRMYKEQHQQQIQQQQQIQHQQQQIQHQQQQMQQQMQHHQQSVQHHPHQHHSQHSSHHSSKSHHLNIKEEIDRSRESKDRNSGMDKISGSGLIVEHSSKIQHSSMSLATNKDQDVREIETRPPSLPAQARIDPSSSASAAALKEKQNENHQILKENIDLKNQMEETNKSKVNHNQYEMAMLYERHREDMRRYYMYQDRVIEQQQQKMEPGIHHHTHHHQTIQSSHGHLQATAYSSSSSLKTHKDDLPSSIPSHTKSNHYGDSTRPSVVSPAKSDHVKNPHSNSTSSPKGSIRDRDSSHSSSKEYMSSSSNSSSKKESKNSERSESSSREDKKSDKIKIEPKVESEGQKPTMETTGPPPPPTNSYAYLHPSYLQPPPPHFPHMPFEPAHAMYRGAINPMIVSAPHYGSSPYVHPQIRYVTPGACEIPPHPHPPDAIAGKLHPAGPSKALDLLQQVSQHYTTTHKIHELQEHAMMSPTPAAGAPAPSTSSSGSGKGSSSESATPSSKVDVASSRDASRSPPTQRHLHTHHHTHVGVGYPIYDPYGVSAQKTYT